MKGLKYMVKFVRKNDYGEIEARKKTIGNWNVTFKIEKIKIKE